MQPAKTIQFDAEGVTLSIPALSRKVAVRKGNPGALRDKPSTGADFRPIRLVLEFDLYDEDAPEAPLAGMEAGFMLRVRYIGADVRAAGGKRENLKLGLYKAGRWKVISNAQHAYTLQPGQESDESGFGQVTISDWGDPTVAWGK